MNDETILDTRTVNYYAGKAMLGQLTVKEQQAITRHAQGLEFFLDQEDEKNEVEQRNGWRERI